MAKKIKELTASDFAADAVAFRRIPSKENYLVADQKSYWRLLEIRDNGVAVCQPVGRDPQYTYYLRLTEFDPKDRRLVKDVILELETQAVEWALKVLKKLKPDFTAQDVADWAKVKVSFAERVIKDQA